MANLTLPENQRTITSLRNSTDNQRTITSLTQTAHFEEIFFNYVNANDVTNALLLVNAQKVDIDCVNATGETGLIVACRLGYDEMVKRFVEMGADVNLTDDDEWSALINACKEGFTDIVSYLMAHDADINHSELGGWTGLNWSTYKNHIEIVKMLIEASANVNIIDEHGVTMVIWAAGRGYTDVVFELVKANANINVTDKFGNTPLMWACRKGYLDIVRILLAAGADVDILGMNSWTPLILATKGNFRECVDVLLQKDANVNVVDKDGCSALTIAAREGYSSIVDMLLSAGAYVNISDRRGDSILTYAVRGGYLDIVKSLLGKYADVNAKDSSGRTALFIAVDKGYADIVAALLECRPDTEIRAKDGDTALLRAVRNRNALIVQMLVKYGAKVSATDNAGDNCLHLVLRARSKRLAQILLSKPKDSRLLYRHNKDGETPYSIDQSHAHPILPHIFGPMESHANSEAMLGYDLYSTVLADIVSEPALPMPLTVGLYAKWGSGKSFLMNKIKESMTSFMRSWLEMVEFKWDWAVFTFVVLLSLALSPLTHAAFGWLAGVLAFFAFIACVLVAYGLIIYCSRKRHWPWAFSMGQTMAQYVAKLKLLLKLLFCHPPTLREQDILACPLMFLFADYHRLSSIGGEQSLARIIVTLHQSVEHHYGRFTTRLWHAFKPKYASSNSARFRKICGIPYVYIAVCLFFASLLAIHLFIYLTIDLRNGGSIVPVQFKENFHHNYTVDARVALPSLSSNNPQTKQFAEGVMISAAILLVVSLLLAGYPLALVFIYSFIQLPEYRVKKAVGQVDRLKFEGFMELLQREVELLTETVNCMDSFTGSQTRLVVFVDGLDSCEQERMLLVLDAISLLFTQRNTKFVVILAVDPHIVIRAVHLSLHSVFRESEISGHEYLRNLVQMPFYLQNTALQKLHERIRKRSDSAGLDFARQKFMRQDTMYGSYLSLAESTRGSFRALDRGAGSQAATKLSQVTLFGGQGSEGRHMDFSARIIRDDYFSNINPRSMRRIINTLNLTGRLMRSFDMEFNWLTLGVWISLIEQWPYRMSWIIDYCETETHFSDNMDIRDVYEIVKPKIPCLRIEDPMVEIDRNPKNFEQYLSSNRGDPLTVYHIRSFVPFTSNLDPYIRKLIKERREAERGEGQPKNPTFRSSAWNETSNQMASTDPNQFAHESVVKLLSQLVAPQAPQPLLLQRLPPSHVTQYFSETLAKTRLSTLSVDEVCALVKKLNFSEENSNKYCDAIKHSSLSGLVLSICDLSTLKQELGMTFGDWELFRLMVLTLRDTEVSIYLQSQEDILQRQGTEEILSRPPGSPPNLEQVDEEFIGSDGQVMLNKLVNHSPSAVHQALSRHGSFKRPTVKRSERRRKPPSSVGSNEGAKAARANQQLTANRALLDLSSSVVLGEVENQQDWLQQRLSPLDNVEFAGDRYLIDTPITSNRSSIIFEEDDEAIQSPIRINQSHIVDMDGPIHGNGGPRSHLTSGGSEILEKFDVDNTSPADSTASIFGSRDNLSGNGGRKYTSSGVNVQWSDEAVGAGKESPEWDFSGVEVTSKPPRSHDSRRSSIAKRRAPGGGGYQPSRVTVSDQPEVIQLHEAEAEFEAKLAGLEADRKLKKKASRTFSPSLSMFLSLGEGKSRSTSPKTVSPRNKEESSDPSMLGDGDKSEKGGRSFFDPSPSVKHNFTTAPSTAPVKVEESASQITFATDTESNDLKLSIQSSEEEDDSNDRNLLTVKQQPSAIRPSLFGIASRQSTDDSLKGEGKLDP